MILLVLPAFLDTPYKIIPQITLEGTAWYEAYMVFDIIDRDSLHIGYCGDSPIYFFQKDSMLTIAYDNFTKHKTWYVRADTLFIRCNDCINSVDFYDQPLNLFKIKVISPQALPFFEMERCYPSKYEDCERFENETEEWKKYFREHGS